MVFKIGDYVKVEVASFENIKFKVVNKLCEVFVMEDVDTKNIRALHSTLIRKWTDEDEVKYQKSKKEFNPALDAIEYAFNRKPIDTTSFDFYKAYKNEIDKFAYYHIKIEPTLDFLPNKIVIDYTKKKVTILFALGDGSYVPFTAKCSEDDEFDEILGFAIAYYKYIHRELEDKDLRYRFENIEREYFCINVLEEYLLNNGMSAKQIDKLNGLRDKDKLVFNVKGINHEIAIERKGEK